MTGALLSRLADAAGIEPRYWDIRGQLHERSPEAARAILQNLGIPARDDAEVAASLANLSERPWREVLPPVVAATEMRPIEIDFRLSAPLGKGMLKWSLVAEAGETAGGEVALASMQVVDGVEIAGVQYELRRLALPPQSRGYYRLRVQLDKETQANIVVAPAKCYLPLDCERRPWGVAAQTYALHSEKDWGIGDFSCIGDLAHWLAPQDVEAVALSPLHALFLDAPELASPYSPSSRLFLNPLFLDVTAIPEFGESEEARALVASLETAGLLRTMRKTSLIHYAAVARAKLATLEKLHKQFCDRQQSAGGARSAAYRQFVAQSGVELDRFVAFQLLSERHGHHDWLSWEQAYRDPRSEAVTQLLNEQKPRADFFRYLQWQCDEQLSSAAKTAHGAGMRLGLYRDLAVSVASNSSDCWSRQDQFMGMLRVGAPPDPFNEAGQEWGVVPLNPVALRNDGYEHFVSLLRANMRHAGVLRIDHVMGWQRLFVIPAGAPASQGAYLRYPLDALLSIAALESQLCQCVVVGEDLGTVPEGFRERMAAANVLSTRVLYFEQENGRFRRPAEYPALASVTATTHDLATFRGYWDGVDISEKAATGILRSTEEEAAARNQRSWEKRQLVDALFDEGLLASEMVEMGAEKIEWSVALLEAILIYLAKSNGFLFVAQLDDLYGEAHQANIPGTLVPENWRRRPNRSLDSLREDASLRKMLTAIASARKANPGG